MAGGYQPLATYGALVDISVEEARFEPDVDDQEFIQTGRIGAQVIRTADGFQSLVYLHDGLRHRVLVYWQNDDAISRFHRGKRAELLEIEGSEWPDSPWITRLDGIRNGVARSQLMGPRMNLEQTDLIAPSPPAAAIIHDVTGLRDAGAIFDIWREMVPSRGFAEIQQFRGFMFFSACDFGNGDLTVYLAFRTGDDLAAFMQSEVNTKLQQRVIDTVDAQYAASSLHHGRLLAWTVRQLG